MRNTAARELEEPPPVRREILDPLPMQLGAAAEKMRLASVAISRLSMLLDDQDHTLCDHVERLECRAEELMRAARRLADDMGLAERWGLDILFATSEDETEGPAALGPAYDSVELEPFELLGPVDEPADRARAWSPRVVMPTPPLARNRSSDRWRC